MITNHSCPSDQRLQTATVMGHTTVSQASNEAASYVDQVVMLCEGGSIQVNIPDTAPCCGEGKFSYINAFLVKETDCVWHRPMTIYWEHRTTLRRLKLCWSLSNSYAAKLSLQACLHCHSLSTILILLLVLKSVVHLSTTFVCCVTKRKSYFYNFEWIYTSQTGFSGNNIKHVHLIQQPLTDPSPQISHSTIHIHKKRKTKRLTR